MTEPATPPLVDVCVCTYQRESLSKTLASIDAQLGLTGGVRILVADNDVSPSAKARVENDVGRWPRDYIHAPARNISIARNALLDASTAPFIVWIDDDEIADPSWLSNLLSAIGDHDAAFGPVRALYPDAAPEWLKAADLHSTQAVVTPDGVITGYTSNAIVRRDAVGGERFLEALGRSGGEDTEFFSRLHGLGRRYVAAPGAIVEEPAAPNRLSLRWLEQRAFRAGQTHARSYLIAGRRGRGLVEAGGKAIACIFLSAALAWNGVARRKMWVRGALHRGVVARLLGADDVQLY
jgi:succinoglycan biosynthesis protein ExoM